MSVTDATAVAEAVVFSIPEVNLADFKAKFATLVAKAVKLGCELPTYTVVEVRDVPVTADYVDPATGKFAIVGVTHVYDITVTGPAPSFNGWAFIAVIDYADGVTVVNTNTDDIDPAWWKITEGHCDHCNTDRRRNKVVVVEHADEGRKVVGTTCLKDFLGHASPELLASYAEVIATLDFSDYEDDDWGSGRHVVFFGVTELLATTAVVIEVAGWIPRSAAGYGRMATADTVRELIAPYDAKGRSESNEFFAAHPVTDAHRNEAVAAKAWAEAISDKDAERSDYLMNLRALNSVDTVAPNRLGFIASTIAAYRKDQGWAIERAERAKLDEAAKDSVHFGAVKERLDVTATLTFVMGYDGDYGTTTLVKGLTLDGNVVVWWASGSQDFTAGETLTGKATVKAHEVREGVAQTVVNRWSWLRVADGETPAEAIKRDKAEAKVAKAEAKAAEARRVEFRAAEEAERVERQQLHRLFAWMQSPNRWLSKEDADAQRDAARKLDRELRQLFEILSTIYPFPTARRSVRYQKVYR